MSCSPPASNPAFGLPIINTFYDQDWAFGWGNRFSNWELSGSVQQELMPGMSLDIGYFRRNYLNFSVQDNRAVAADEFEQFTVNVPTDQNLPGGGGGTVTLVDIRPEAFGRVPDNITTHADTFGGESETWNGLDVTVDARIEGILLQGGVSTGTTSTDFCALSSQVPETIAGRAGRLDTVPMDFCQASTNWLTQVKLLGSYTFPYDIQVAATFQSISGPERAADHTFCCGRTGGCPGAAATRQAQSLPTSSFRARSMESGFIRSTSRFTKIIALAGAQLRAMFDIFNVFNANAVTAEEYGLGPTYLQPIAIMPGRLLKFAFQFDF